MKIVLLETNTPAIHHLHFFIATSLGYVNASGNHYTLENKSDIEQFMYTRKELEEPFTLTSIYDLELMSRYLVTLENDEWKIW